MLRRTFLALPAFAIAAEQRRSLKITGLETTLTINPDPFDGRTIEIDIKARVISDERFGSPAEAQRAVAAAPVITVTGVVGGAERMP